MSFTDMMSSARGPGVIGMFLALLVLLGFGALFVFAFDEGAQGGDLSIEAFVARQTKEIESLRFRIEKGEQQLAGAAALQANAELLADLKRQNKFRGIELETLNTRATGASEALAALDAKFEKYKDQYRAFVRGNAKGQTIETLETSTGRTYRKVVVREVTPVGIQIRHADGQQRIPYEELPEDMQNLFQFDPKQKAEAIAREIEARKQHESAVAAVQASTAAEKEEQKQQEAETERADAARAIGQIENRLEALDKEIERLEDRLAAEARKSGVRNTAQIKGQISAKQREINELRSKLTTLRSIL